MEEQKTEQRLVEFSTSRIELVNDGSERQRQVYQLQNRSPSSLRVRAAISKDSDTVFCLVSGSDEKYLAPGLKVPVVLQYSPRDERNHRGYLEIYMNASLILTVPIAALPPSPKLNLDRDVVDVGTLVTDHQIHKTSFSLSNRGNQMGTFVIDVSPLPMWISLQPTHGQLEPSGSTDIQVEILCKEEREFSYKLSIHSTKQEGCGGVTEDGVSVPLSVTLCGHLKCRKLRLLDLHTDSTLNCVTFDPTYYDTETSRGVILYNDSPVATGFLCLLDTRAEGSEVGVDGREGVSMAYTEGGPGQGRWREQGDAPPVERLLRVEPAQDSLLPYEKRVIELTFAPTFVPSDSGWDHFQATPTRRDYALYLRFMAVGTNRDTNSADLEVAVSASALPVNISLEPSSPLEFGACPTLHTCTQELKVHNNSDTLPLPFHTHRLPNYTCHPPTGHIPPSHTHTLSLTFSPKQLGPLNSTLKINILTPQSNRLSSSETRPGVVKTLAVELRGEGTVGKTDTEREKRGRRAALAHPDDLATSIRPYDGSCIITPYTHTPRYTYIDRDYAYNERERQQLQRHKDYYLHYLRDCQEHRHWRKKEKALSNAMCGPEKELGMLAVKAPDNSPSKLRTATVKETEGGKGRRGGRRVGGVLTTDTMLNATSAELREVKQCSSEPDCVQAASEITSQLSPHQLSLVTINPATLEYGVVAVDSVVERTVIVRNHLNQHISVAFKLAGSGLLYPQSSPSLTLILPPSSFTRLPLTMQRSTEGILESSLRCEFVCMPTHDSPDTALFRLVVVNEKRPGGGVAGDGEGVSGDGRSVPSDSGVGKNSLLTLRAELGHPVCSFREQRVLFGSVPLGLTTTRTVHLQNTGEHHAYFQVLNPEPCPGLWVHPESGCVPVGGASDLKLHLHPNSTSIFDTEVSVRIRGGRKLTLKIVGAAEEPTVTIDRESFIFGGVHCGSKAPVPFTVSNMGSTRCELMFDFSFLSDFSLILPKQSSPYAEVVGEPPSTDMPGIYTLQLPAKTSTECQLMFSPSDVAAYDFQLPVLVNGGRPPSPPPSPWPPSSQHPSKINPHHHKRGDVLGSYESTPCRRVLATAMRAPLSLSPSTFSFSFPVGYLETMTEPALHSQTAKLLNVGDSPLTWTLGLSGISRIEDGTFRLVLPSGSPLALPPTNVVPPGEGEVGYLAPQESCRFSVQCSPGHHGEFQAEIPLLLNGNMTQPYSSLTLTANVPVGRITLSPKCIALAPVPLDLTMTAQYTLLVQDFPNAVDLEAVVPSIPDCASLSVKFPDGCHVADCSQAAVEVVILLEFCSSQPITLTGHLIFRDTNSGKKLRVAYAFAADNSVFSVAQFLAQNVTTSSIKLNTHQVPTITVSSPNCAVVSTSSTLSLAASHTRACTPLGSSFVGDISYSDMIMQECVGAVCRWVSGYGWAQGVRHITSPTDLRERVGHDIPRRGVKQRSSIKVYRGLLVELVSHICGRLPPGVPMNPPPCITPSEKINQHYSTFTTILTFLKNQGGQLWSLSAESLLDYRDYQQWLLDTPPPSPSSLAPVTTQEEFQERSGQAWTYLLLQIVKVLVLPRVTNHVPAYLRPSVSHLDSQPCSNVYSRPERIILAWLNYHYVHQRAAVLKCDDEEYVREVVSFDVDLMDCTVLACVLSAYCPFLMSSHFNALYSRPSSTEQCSHNALVLLDAFTHIGINYDCQASDLVTPNPVFLLLLCCHLYQCLPSLSPSPSQTVLCQGLLHSDIRQKITLENPSSKSLTYRALLRGESANKFSIMGGSDIITIPSRKNASVEVQYRGHQIEPCDAVLLLVAESGCGTYGTSMAFQLQGQVTGAKPQSRMQVSAALYQVETVQVQVISSFQTAGHFNIHLYESADDSFSTQSPTRRKTVTRSLGFIPVTALKNRSTDKMRVFNPHAHQVYLEPGLPTTLTLTFVPLKMEPRHCSVLLQNEDLGEMIISVRATVKLPFPTLPKTSGNNSQFFVNSDTQTLHLKAYAGEIVEEDLILSSENASLESALLEICQWEMSDVELKRRMLTDSLKYAALASAMECLGLEKKVMTATGTICEDVNKLVFRVNGGNENFQVPESIAVPGGSGGVARLPVRFHSEEPGQYECHLILASAHDVRVFIIESTVMARGQCAELEFTTTAMQPLTQDIPLVNPSTVEWPLHASLRGTGFSGPDTLLTPPLSTTCYPLTFNPKKEGQVEGELRLVNTNDGMEHMYILKGVAEKPLAQDHIVLHTQAKTSLTHILHVPNHNERTTEFQVESDLDCVSGPPSITIAGGDLVDYPLLIRPIRRGVLSGAVAFVAQAPSSRNRRRLSTPCTQQHSSTPHHVWFHLEVRVDHAPPDEMIPITCPTLSSTVTDLPVTNSLAQPLLLDVTMEGAYISGPDKLQVEANSTTVYPLTFEPTLNGKTTAQVIFDGGPDGEFWYQLELVADDPTPVALPDINCELGKTIQVAIPLTNPLDSPVLFTCECSNTKHFIIPGLSDSQVEVQAGSSNEVSVLFKPSCIGAGEHVARVSFTSHEFGTQVFILQGIGAEPSSMEPTTIQASLNSNTTRVVTFTNPLDITAHFRIALQDSQTSEHFCLLLKRTHSILLHPGVTLDIPIMFAPDAMHRHKTTIIVSIDRRWREKRMGDQLNLVWRYPVIGEPEFRPISPKSAPRITCQAKERMEERLEVVLVGCKMSKAATFRPVTPNLEIPMAAGELTASSSTSDSYLYQLVCSDGEYSALISNCVGIKLIRKIADEEGPIKLVFGIVFVPPKAFSCIAELHVSSGDGGGVWKFPIHLSAAVPSPDDVIVIEAAGLNKESQIQFRLTSLKECSLPFTAHLTEGSDPDISVSPTSGELAPVNSRGTLFFITYKPKTYGRDHKAKLVVQCESNEWCYEIVGKPTQYSPPYHTPARVQHRETSFLMLSQTKKNFIRENIKLCTSRLPVQ